MPDANSIRDYRAAPWIYVKALAAFGIAFALAFVVTRERALKRITTPADHDVPSLVQRSYSEAQDWLLRNVAPDGKLPYSYHLPSDTFDPLNNDVRQLLASRLLAELATGDSSLIPVHRANITWVMSRWFRETSDGVGYIYWGRKSKLGVIAVALQAISLSPLYEDYKSHAEKLARGVLSLMAPDGSFRPWFREPPYPYDAEGLLYFYSGEAILALLD